MTTVAVIGETADVTTDVVVGPVRLRRESRWSELERLADVSRGAGFETIAVPGDELFTGDDPDCWILSDAPFAALRATGTLERLLVSVGSGAGLVMLGGALSFGGEDGRGGWGDPAAADLLPVQVARGADACEAPAGLRVEPCAGLPASFAALLRRVPPVFGWNAVLVGDSAVCLATFSHGAPALVVGSGMPTSVAFMSDLMPHWGSKLVAWRGLPGLLWRLVDLALGGAGTSSLALETHERQGGTDA